jgi:hypothetical protein
MARRHKRISPHKPKDNAGKKTTPRKPSIEELYPAVADWVQNVGWVEIGDQQGVGFVVRGLDYGGMIFESTRPKTLSQAMSSLERGISRHFQQEAM